MKGRMKLRNHAHNTPYWIKSTYSILNQINIFHKFHAKTLSFTQCLHMKTDLMNGNLMIGAKDGQHFLAKVTQVRQELRCHLQWGLLFRCLFPWVALDIRDLPSTWRRSYAVPAPFSSNLMGGILGLSYGNISKGKMSTLKNQFSVFKHLTSFKEYLFNVHLVLLPFIMKSYTVLGCRIGPYE